MIQRNFTAFQEILRDETREIRVNFMFFCTKKIKRRDNDALEFDIHPMENQRIR